MVRFKGSELAKGLSDQGEQKGDKNKNEGKHDHAPLNSGAAHEDVQKISSTKESKRREEQACGAGKGPFRSRRAKRREKQKQRQRRTSMWSWQRAFQIKESKKERKTKTKASTNKHVELAKGLSDQGEQKGEKNKNKGKHDHAPAELAKGLSDQGEQKGDKLKNQGKHDHAPLNSGGAHEVVQKISSTKESKRTVKAEKKEQATLSDKNNDPAQKDEPKMVRFKGSELAKKAVHLDEMMSGKDSAELVEQQQHAQKHSNAKFYAEKAEEEAHKLPKHDKSIKKHSNAKFDSKSSRTEDDSLAEYHPGSKLYELEGGRQDKPQIKDEEDFMSDFMSEDFVSEEAKHSTKTKGHSKADHKQHVDVVSEAMGVAFGDSGSPHITHKHHNSAKMFSSTESTEAVDTDAFWGEEDPSEIDREFTVEGIPT